MLGVLVRAQPMACNSARLRIYKNNLHIVTLLEGGIIHTIVNMFSFDDDDLKGGSQVSKSCPTISFLVF